MDLKMRPSSAAKCFGGASHTATGGQWMTWICGSFLVFICFLIVSFPFHRAPILSINKNLTLMRERGFDFHFPLWVLHIFFIFLLVQLIISVWRVRDTIPGTTHRARGEWGDVFVQLLCLHNFQGQDFLPRKKYQRTRKQFNGYLWCSQVVLDALRFFSFYIKRPDPCSSTGFSQQVV